MTVWRARLARRGDPDRVLCGRMTDGQYTCDEEVCRRYSIATSEGPAVGGDLVVLPDGLTNEWTHELPADWTPDVYRWSRLSQDRIKDARGPRDKRPGPAQPRPRGLAGAAAVATGHGPKGWLRPAVVPITLPCAQNHLNLVDRGVLLP